MSWGSSPSSLFDVGTHLGCKRCWGISVLTGALLGLEKWGEKVKSWWHRPSFFTVKKNSWQQKPCRFAESLQYLYRCELTLAFVWLGEGAGDCISELPPSSPDPMVAALLAKEAQNWYFWLVNILVQCFLSCSLSLHSPLQLFYFCFSWFPPLLLCGMTFPHL